MQIQQLHKKDQSIALSMRGTKFRKLCKGLVVTVPASCIRRKSSHFVDDVARGVQVITGCNGWLWIGTLNKAAAAACTTNLPRPFGGAAASTEPAAEYEPDAAQWEAVARFANAALALARLRLPVFLVSMERLVTHSEQQGVRCCDMLGMDFLSEVASIEEHSRVSTMDVG
jgi:exosome complex component RRP4